MEASLVKWTDKHGVRWFFKKYKYESVEFENYSEGEYSVRESFNQGIFTQEEFIFLFWAMYENCEISKHDTTEVYEEKLTLMQKFPFENLCYN